MTAPKMLLRSAEEIAREMVSEGGLVRWEGFALGLEAPQDTGVARRVIVSIIEQARAEGAAAAIAAQQPRDLAGRIRALVQEYAGRWADASDAAADELMHDLMERLVQAVSFARRGMPLASLIDDMRAAHPVVADDLERILREHEAQR